MKFTENQLAIASYFLVLGNDFLLTPEEKEVLKIRLKTSKQFKLDESDYNLILSLYKTGSLSWDEITGFVRELTLLTRYRIYGIICSGIIKTGGNNKVLDGWNTARRFREDIDVNLSAYNEWATLG